MFRNTFELTFNGMTAPPLMYWGVSSTRPSPERVWRCAAFRRPATLRHRDVPIERPGEPEPAANDSGPRRAVERAA